MASVPQVVFGSLAFRSPHRLARFEEQLDAIGSRTRVSEVEPAGWKVLITKVFGGGTALFGALVLAVGLLVP